MELCKNSQGSYSGRCSFVVLVKVMTTIEEKLEKLEDYIREKIPKYSREIKEDSKWMKFLNFFARAFNDGFMTDYITTTYPKVYWPKESMRFTSSVFRTTCHEAVHLLNAKRQTVFLHTFLYGFPQWLTLLSLLSILAVWLGPWWLLNLCWLLCLAPIPAYFRMREEREAYVMSMAVSYWMHGSVSDYQVEWIAKQFYTSQYYFMWPFKKAIIKSLHKEKERMMAGKYQHKPIFAKVKEIIES